jgi:hypothetical protein
MLIHSYLYYRRYTNIISDHEFDRRARKLVELQKQLGDKKIGFYDEAFVDWNGDTGYHLPQDDWIVTKALQLLRTHENLGE